MGFWSDAQSALSGSIRLLRQARGPDAPKYRGRSRVQIQAYLCAIVQNLKRLFPLYCWLLAVYWSYSTNNPPGLKSNQSRPTNER